jgi:hypothetical protein
VFALPLTDGSFLLGVIIRRDQASAQVGFALEQVRDLPSSMPPITPEDLGLLTSVETNDLDQGVWPFLGVIERYDKDELPDPPVFAGDTAETAAELASSMDRIVRARKDRAIIDATFLTEHPDLIDPAVGARYLRLPTERLLPFIRTKLAHWGTLPRLLLERLDLEHGAVYSTLPAEVGVEVASSDPRWGGKLSRRGRRLIRGHHIYPDGRREPLYDDRLSAQGMISEWLGSEPGHLCVLGLPTNMPEGLPRSTAHLDSIGTALSFEQESYLLLPSSAAQDSDGLSKAIRSAHNDWHAIGFLGSSLPSVRPRSAHSSIDIEQLESLSDSVQTIIVGAYDGEGYVLWTRADGDRWLAG